MKKVCIISMTCETCCDYWFMDALACGRTVEEAELNARVKFRDKFDLEPSSVSVVAVFDDSDIKLGFVGIISDDEGSK